MTRVLAIAFLLAACTYQHGKPLGDDDDMGSGGSSGEEDSDGDTVVDLLDNCPDVNNTDQLDHDDDTRGDACDGCPHLIDAGQDTDGDGVGDGCDPHADTPGDRLAFFEGFYGPVAWKPEIGANTWQTADGFLRQADVTAPYTLVRDDTPNPRDVFIDARIRVNALSTSTTSRRSTGLVVAYDDPTHYLFCVLAAQGTGADVNAGEQYTDFFGTPDFDFTPAPLSTQMSSDWITLQARTRRVETTTQIECTGHRAGTLPATAMFETSASATGDIGVRTNGADASFDYVFVVEVPAGSS